MELSPCLYVGGRNAKQVFFLFVWFASENGLETRNLGLVESFPCYQTAKFHFNIVEIIEITDKVPSKNYVT